MPQIMIRGGDLDRATKTRVRDYARANDISESAAAVDLIRFAFAQQDARSAGGAARHQGTTKAERSEAARKAVTARWDKNASTR